MTANLGSTTQRNIPDVALTGDNIYVASGGNGQASGDIGGTSCAAPLWAGFGGVGEPAGGASGRFCGGVHQPGDLRHRERRQFALQLRGLFHDVTAGNNYWSSSPSQYVAVAG